MTAAAAAIAPDQPRTIVVTLHDDATSSKSVQKALDNIVGLKKLSAMASSGKPTHGLDSTEGIFLPTLGAVIMQADMDQVSRLAKEAESGTSDIVIVTPERQFTTADVSYGDDYLHGYRDGVDGLVEKLLKKGGSGGRRPEMASALGDAAGTQAFTYGLNMVGAVDSPYSGDGARVAILDMGIDFGHPAFAGRIKESAFFVGTSAQDGHPRQPWNSLRRNGLRAESFQCAGSHPLRRRLRCRTVRLQGATRLRLRWFKHLSRDAVGHR